MEAGLVQDDFADTARLNRSSISPMEQGRHDIRLSTLLQVAGTLGLRADALLRLIFEERSAE